MACEGDVSHRDRLPQMPVSVLPVNVTMPSGVVIGRYEVELYALRPLVAEREAGVR